MTVCIIQVGLAVYLQSEPAADAALGHLKDEVYEFLSRNPDEVSFNVVRTIAMWSCCDKDEWSPGWVVAPSYPLPEGHRPDFVSFSHDILPDSNLEQYSVDEPDFRRSANNFLSYFFGLPLDIITIAKLDLSIVFCSNFVPILSLSLVSYGVII